MRTSPHLGAAALGAAFFVSSVGAQEEVPGERVPAEAVSPLVVETIETVLERERTMVRDPRIRGVWNGEDGRWTVPSESVALATHSGAIALINEWGDPRIGIGFGVPTEVHSAWLAGHGTVPATSLVLVGYRDGTEVARTEPITLERGVARRATFDLEAVDRVEFVASAAGAFAFFSVDDLHVGERVLDFEDLHHRRVVSGTGHAGFVWENGRGLRGVARDGVRAVAPPRSPARQEPPPIDEPRALAAGGGGTAPTVSNGFEGPRLGDPGGGWIPPDTCGAVGPDHFVSVTNANLSAWRKQNGQRVFNVGLDAFFNQTVGDPRAAWDHHAQRWVVMATDFSRGSTLFFGVSATADPSGSWFKFSFRTDQGSDAGRWPDYPTLGLDRHGLYTAAYMVGNGGRMTIWAIDKTNLLAPTPSAPGITAFRSLPWEGSIQPCITYDQSAPQYLVSRYSSSNLRLRRITWTASTPRLFEAGYAPIPRHGTPPDAPARGSATPLSTIDSRPMNAIYRHGSVWLAHGVSAGGKAAVRWYEIDAAATRTVQVGTITDGEWHYFFGSIAVDARGDVAFGFSGSHANAYASAFVTGRRADDPPGETAPPMLVKSGEGAYTRTDRSGRNRWGDYSLTSVDPVDDLGFWSIQEWSKPGNAWGTWIAQFGFDRSVYGDGFAGTVGVPELAALDRPAIGTTIRLRIGSSLGAGVTPGVLLVGTAKSSQTVLGGTLLVLPAISADVPIASPATVLPVRLPNDPTLVGTSLFLQAVQVDAGAAQGLAFTQGLELRPVTR